MNWPEFCAVAVFVMFGPFHGADSIWHAYQESAAGCRGRKDAKPPRFSLGSRLGMDVRELEAINRDLGVMNEALRKRAEKLEESIKSACVCGHQLEWHEGGCHCTVPIIKRPGEMHEICGCPQYGKYQITDYRVSGRY